MSFFFFFSATVIKHIVVICFLRPYRIPASPRMQKVSDEILLQLKVCLLGRLNALPFFRGKGGRLSCNENIDVKKTCQSRTRECV